MPYTKGPWTVEVLQELTDTGERRPASYISSSQGWANSGMAGKRTIAVVGHWRDRPNPEDDARLIAAAPELLEALEEVHEALLPKRKYNLYICARVDEAIRKAKA